MPSRREFLSTITAALAASSTASACGSWADESATPLENIPKSLAWLQAFRYAQGG